MPKNNNFYRHNKPRPARPQAAVEVAGDKETLSLPVEELGLSEGTLALLKNNRFTTVYDVARRTEREMYKIQTFSKKHLLEVKAALTKKGLDFLPVQEFSKTEASAAPQREERGPQQRSDRPRERDGRSRSGNDRPGGKEAQKPRPERVPVKQTPVLLPLNEWRKVNKNGKWGFNNGLQTVIEPAYDEVFFFKEGLACVEQDGLFGFINETGEMVIEPTYDVALSFSEGLAAVLVNEKYGYINKENVMVIPATYEAATAFEEGKARVKEDGRWMSIDPEGNVIYRF